MNHKNSKILNDRRKIEMSKTIKFVDMPKKVITEKQYDQIKEQLIDDLNHFPVYNFPKN